MAKKVPYWKDTLIFSVRDLYNATIEQKQFYAFFKSEFLNCNYLDIKNNSNYAFVLLFDLAEDFRKHKDYDFLYNQYKILGREYPFTLKYTNDKLLETLCSYNSPDFFEITIVKELLQIFNNELQSNKFISRPINWILSMIKYERHDEKNLYIHTLYQLTQLFYKMGFGIAPNKEIDNIRLNFGDTCVIYRNPDGHRISKTFNYELTNSFVKFAAYIVQADKVGISDNDLVERFLNAEFSKDDSLVCNHLIANFRWHALYKKQRLNKEVKNTLKLGLSYDLRNKMTEVLLKLARLNEEVKSNRIERLKQVLPLIGISSNDVKLQLHDTGLNSTDTPTKSQDYHASIEEQNLNRQLATYNLGNNHKTINDKKFDDKLITSLTDIYRMEESISDHPIILEFINDLTNEFKTKRYIVKPIGWLFDYFNCSSIHNKEVNLEIYEIRNILSSLGLTVISGELSNDSYLKPNGICVIFDTFGKYLTTEPTLKKKTKKQIQCLKKQEAALFRFSSKWPISFLRRDEYKFVIIYIQLFTKIIQEDELKDADYKEIDQFILDYVNLMDYDCYLKNVTGYKQFGPELFREYITHYIQAYSRFILFSKKKQVFSYSLKKYVENMLCSNQHNTIICSLIHLVCIDGNINSNRIKSLEKILPVFGYDINNIHYDIHRILSNHDRFITIEKTTNASEYLINEPDSNIIGNGKESSLISIDTKKLQILEQESLAARNMLTDIFVEDDLEDSSNTITKELSTSWKDILKVLSTKQTWSKDEVAIICNDKGIMLNVVLEQINDIAFEKFDDVLVEDDGDNIYVNLDYTQEVL